MQALKKGSYKLVEGEFYGTPKEIWGFRTAAGGGGATQRSVAFLKANAGLFRLSPDLSEIRRVRHIHSLGAEHVIFQQLHHGLRVHRGYVTVHVDLAGRIYLAKNRAVPREMLPQRPDFRLTRKEAVERVKRLFPRARLRIQTVERQWFPKDDQLKPAFRVRALRRRPREEWIVHVNAKTGGILRRYDNLAAVRGRALVFDPSPVTALGDHVRLLGPGGRPRKPPREAYRAVALYGLTGNGRLEGKHVTTRPTSVRHRIRRADHCFLLETRERGFEEVMAYHHIDAAVRWLEKLGYRGRRAIFREPIRVNVNGTHQDNSWYSSGDRLLTFGSGSIDDAEDGETILHELGHAIQDAICRDFGQSAEAAAMGEGFGDYFAASFFADQKPARYRTSVMTWDGLLLGIEERLDPPCLRRVDHALGYDDFDPQASEHENGQIWSATLWEIRELLGRERADRLIIESHFQLDGFTTLARGARAIIDADENLEGGTHRERLRAVFRARKIGPV